MNCTMLLVHVVVASGFVLLEDLGQATTMSPPAQTADCAVCTNGEDNHGFVQEAIPPPVSAFGVNVPDITREMDLDVDYFVGNVSNRSIYGIEDVLGEQSTLVLLLNFQDDQSEPYTPAEIADQIFNAANPESVNARLIELSYGKAWLAGDVLDWITLPVNAADCSSYYSTYASRFQNILDLVDPEVNFSLYRRIIALQPGESACPVFGVGTLGDTSFITDEGLYIASVALAPASSDMPRVAIHELGHNFGLVHQGELECGDAVVGDYLDGCDPVERGNRYDLMAKSTQGHFNASSKARIGWFDAQNMAELGTGTHEITLHPLELPTDQVQTIKIPVSYDLLGSGNGVFYFIEYRRPIGLDEQFTELQDPEVGVLILLQEDGGCVGSPLLDATPHVTSVTYSQLGDSAEAYLVRGETFHDAKHDISITLDSATGDVATVTIDIPRLCADGTCDPGEDSCNCPDDCGPPTTEICVWNGVAGECEPDCNANGVGDGCDIAEGTSVDCPGGVGNGIPDECEEFVDCNANGVLDGCDISGETSTDLNANGIPDECEPYVAVYVDRTNCPGPGTGTEENPFCRIQDATDAQSLDAGQDGVVEIIVADGTYTGDGNKDIRFAGRSIALRSANGPDACIIDMEGVGRGFIFDEQEPAGALLEGFTITNGWEDSYGGGIYVGSKASPTIVNCTVTGNRSLRMGGGIFVSTRAKPAIVNCRVTGNRVVNYSGNAVGGGIACYSGSPSIRDCLIADNEAVDASCEGKGGGMYLSWDSSPTITNCVITRNSAGADGGGISAEEGCNPVIVDTEISDNVLTYHGYGDGGGMCVVRSSTILRHCSITGNTTSSHQEAWGGGLAYYYSDATIEGCTIVGNTAGGQGGGVAAYDSIADLRSCLIAANTGSHGGGVIWHVKDNGSVVAENCTITGNSVVYLGGGIHILQGTANLNSCIVRGNSADMGNEISLYGTVRDATVRAEYSNIGRDPGDIYVWAGNSYVSGMGNMDNGAQFVDFDGPDDDPDTWQDNDYHVLHESPCVDAADPDLAVPGRTWDVDTEPRPFGCAADIGADESWDPCDAFRDGEGAGSGVFNDCNSNCVADECELGANDCNGNSAPDECDLSSGASNDCNANGIPDECDGDCNGNGLADECDLAAATSNDCNANQIPDECEGDCNSNGLADECDLTLVVSVDGNANGVPDECEAPKNRYISLVVDDAGTMRAFRVDMVDSAYFPDSTGVLGWVGEPGWGNVSRVVSAPFFFDGWPSVVYVGDCEIVPAAVYHVLPTPDGVAFDSPVTVATIPRPGVRYFGDVVGVGTGDLPPRLGFNSADGIVNVTDVQAFILTAEGSTSPSVPVTWVDLHGLGAGSPPDYILNVSDLQRILLGLEGLMYTDISGQLDPADCP
ncbi:MAG: hypothetical protein JSU63_06630 [Phycisphaerales bacterium]|nr:MAG: hypothetical protein JSU63_06630 [Phycisphaerales bacterium]